MVEAEKRRSGAGGKQVCWADRGCGRLVVASGLQGVLPVTPALTPSLTVPATGHAQDAQAGGAAVWRGRGGAAAGAVACALHVGAQLQLRLPHTLLPSATHAALWWRL